MPKMFARYRPINDLGSTAAVRSLFLVGLEDMAFLLKAVQLAGSAVYPSPAIYLAPSPTYPLALGLPSRICCVPLTRHLHLHVARLWMMRVITHGRISGLGQGISNL